MHEQLFLAAEQFNSVNKWWLAASLPRMCSGTCMKH